MFLAGRAQHRSLCLEIELEDRKLNTAAFLRDRKLHPIYKLGLKPSVKSGLVYHILDSPPHGGLANNTQWSSKPFSSS